MSTKKALQVLSSRLERLEQRLATESLPDYDRLILKVAIQQTQKEINQLKKETTK